MSDSKRCVNVITSCQHLHAITSDIIKYGPQVRLLLEACRHSDLSKKEECVSIKTSK